MGTAKKQKDKDGYYSILGLDTSASMEAVKHAYHAVSLKAHPDKSGDSAVPSAFTYWLTKVKEAYDVLKDPKRRDSYDCACGHSLPAGWGVTVSKSTGELFYFRRSDGHCQWERPR